MHKEKYPIILIPGIQGTTLTDVNNPDFTKLFTGVKKFFKNIKDIELQANGKSDKGRERIIERSDVEDLAYSEIVNYLRGIGFSVYIFGYDWRKSNAMNSMKLYQFVEELKDKQNDSKFNFLTHSMGSLILSHYIRTLHAEDRTDVILNRAIMTVPPLMGSVEAAKNLVMGRSMFINSSDNVRKILRTFPAIFELFPVYKGSLTHSGLDVDPANYVNYDEFWQHNAADLFSPIKDVKENAEKKRRQFIRRFKELLEFRNDLGYSVFDFSKLSAQLRKKIIVIAGNGEDTLISLNIISNKDRQKNFFDFKGSELNKSEDGDGTVPLISASFFKDSIDTFSVESNAWETRYNSFFMYDWHAFFLNNGRVQNVIKRFFERELETLTGEWYMSPGANVKKI